MSSVLLVSLVFTSLVVANDNEFRAPKKPRRNFGLDCGHVKIEADKPALMATGGAVAIGATVLAVNYFCPEFFGNRWEDIKNSSGWVADNTYRKVFALFGSSKEEMPKEEAPKVEDKKVEDAEEVKAVEAVEVVEQVEVIAAAKDAEEAEAAEKKAE